MDKNEALTQSEQQDRQLGKSFRHQVLQHVGFWLDIAVITVCLALCIANAVLSNMQAACISFIGLLSGICIMNDIVDV